MDANGLRFWGLAEPAEWRLGEGVAIDRARRRLRLANQRPAPVLVEDEAMARARVELPPQAVDAVGTRAWVEAQGVFSAGALPLEETLPPASRLPPVKLEGADGGRTVTDLAMDDQGVLTVASGGRVRLYDPLDRWDAHDLAMPSVALNAWRVAALPGGGAFVLDRQHRRLFRWRGAPAPRNFPPPRCGGTFGLDPEVAGQPALELVLEGLAPGETLAGIATSLDGSLALLSWSAEGALVRVLRPASSTLNAPITLLGPRLPYSLAWIDEDHVAVLFTRQGGPPVPEALVYPVQASGQEALPLGDLFPLRDHDGGPFVHGLDGLARYPTADLPRGLRRVSRPGYAPLGQATEGRNLDSGDPDTAWHRLYVEAIVPEGCGVMVELAATERATTDANTVWHRHDLGQVPVEAPLVPVREEDGPTWEEPTVPRLAWLRAPSELPGHPGLLCDERKPGISGLFMALVQRPGLRVRTLRGRRLHVRVTLYGNGRSTPEIAALRVYASRASYVARYLPELYHEDTFAPEADQPGRSTRPDFLERFVHLFEGVLTPLEDRVANAHVLTLPAVAPAEGLDWLARWVGLSLDPRLSEGARRTLLGRSALLARTRGTRRGLELMLDSVTEGGFARGEFVVLEGWRLRRTFATILGADLADEADPLTMGLAVSGNSVVGDTLFLGDEERKEFLALYDADLALTARERQAVDAFLAGLAHRALVLVHRDSGEQHLELIRRVVAEEVPAHVSARVEGASLNLVVGVRALVGVETHLGRHAPPKPVRLGSSQLGAGDRLIRPASLDPRLEGGSG